MNGDRRDQEVDDHPKKQHESDSVAVETKGVLIVTSPLPDKVAAKKRRNTFSQARPVLGNLPTASASPLDGEALAVVEEEPLNYPFLELSGPPKILRRPTTMKHKV